MNFSFTGRDDATGELIFENHDDPDVVLHIKCKEFEFSIVGRNDDDSLYLQEGTVQNTDEGIAEFMTGLIGVIK